jgi:hypothetical protein
MELAAFAKLEKVDIKIYQPGFMYVIIMSDWAHTVPYADPVWQIHH